MIVRDSVGSPGSARVRATRLLGALLLLASGPTSAVAQSNSALLEPPPISQRAAEDRSLNLMLDAEAVIESEHASGAPAGSFRAAQDVPPRVDWSRRLGGGWDLEPVLLNRRQAGQPIRPDDDESNKLLGIEMRARF